MHPKTTSSAIPTLTSAGPNGSPGTWKPKATTPCSRPGTSWQAATSSSPWMPPPGTPHVPSPSSPRTTSRPSSRPPNGQPRSVVIPPVSRDGSYPCGYDPVTWKDCSDRSSTSTWWIKTKRPLVPPCCKVSNTSDVNPAVHQPFHPYSIRPTHPSVHLFQEPCQPCGISPIHATPILLDAKSSCVD